MCARLGTWWLVLVMVGCGAAPPARDESVSLALTPAVGTRYDALIQTEARVHARPLDFIETTHASFEVRAAEPNAITLHGVLIHSQVRTHGQPVRLPPMERTETCEADLHVNLRGGIVDASTTADAGCISLLEGPWLEALLPVGTVRVGDTWVMPDGPVMSGIFAFPMEAPRAETIELASTDGARAALRWSGTAHGAFTPNSETSLTIDRTIEGTASIALVDGIARTGSWQSTATIEATPAWRLRSIPDAVSVRWCLARDGEAPCDALVPPADESTTPAATVYEGEACTTRLAALDARLAAITVPLEETQGVAIPAIDHGAQPIAALAPSVVVTEDGLLVSGRTQTLAEVVELMDGLTHAWAQVHDGAAFPARVHVLAAAATPASALEPLVTALQPTLAIDLIVATGPAPASPPLPSWVAAIPSEPAARSEALEGAWGSAVAACAPVIGVYQLIIGGNLDREARPRLMRGSLAEGLAGCGCGGTDVDGLEAIAAAALTSTEPPLGSLVIPAGNTGPTIRVRGTVADLAHALAARATPGSAVRLRFH